MTIVIAKNEQTPWSFPDTIKTVRGTLRTADYALEDDGNFAIERKSLPDFASTVVRDADRFERELDRMAGWPAKIIIVEANIFDMFEHNYPNPKISPAHLLSICADFAMRNIQVLWGGDALGAAALALAILKKRDQQLQAEIPF